MMPKNDTGEKLKEELLSNNSNVQPYGEGLDNVFVFKGAPGDFYSSITAGLKKIADEYINNPDTRVIIKYNEDRNENLYSVQVCGTDFWLYSFDTEQEAVQYIKDNDLVMGE